MVLAIFFPFFGLPGYFFIAKPCPDYFLQKSFPAYPPPLPQHTQIKWSPPKYLTAHSSSCQLHLKNPSRVASRIFMVQKKLAFLQLLRSSEAAEKLRKSFVKAGGIGTCRKAGFYAGLQKSQLLRSFYATLRKAAEKPAFLQLLRRAS